MRYLKSAAFLMLTVSSSMYLLSQAAIAAPAKVEAKTRLSLEKQRHSRAESPQSQTSARGSEDTIDHTASLILDGAESNAKTTRLHNILAGVATNLRSPHR